MGGEAELARDPALAVEGARAHSERHAQSATPTTSSLSSSGGIQSGERPMYPVWAPVGHLPCAGNRGRELLRGISRVSRLDDNPSDRKEA